MINKKLIALSTALAISSFTVLSSTSCQSGLAAMKIEKATKKIFSAVRGDKEIQSNVTKYEIPLRLFGRDLAYIIGEPRTITISSIRNETNDPTIADNIYGILTTAITKLTSSPIAGKYLTIYTGATAEAVAGINVSGKITELDQILSTGMTANLDATFGGGSTKTDTSVSLDRNNVAKVLTLDLHAQISTGTYTLALPLGYASNTSILYKKTEGGSFSLYILGSGFSIGGNATVADAPNYVLRMLTEFSMMQLLGRIYTVPYWHCFKTRNNDEVMFQYLVEEWVTLPVLPKEGGNYKDSKLGRYADIARLFYGYYLAGEEGTGKVYSFKKVKVGDKIVEQKVPGISFLRKEVVVKYVDDVDENGNPIKREEKVEVRKINEENVKKFIKILMDFYHTNPNMYNFDTYYALFNQAPFCSYPYNDKLKDYLLTKIQEVKFEAYDNDIKDPPILYADFLKMKFKNR